MADNCEGCKEAHSEIDTLKSRVSVLESFKTWAEPIIKDIKALKLDLSTLKSDNKRMMLVGGLFVAVVAYVYVYQIYPSFGKQSDSILKILEKQNADKIEIIREINTFKLEVFKEIAKTEKDVKTHTTKASKINYRGIKKIIEKPRE